MLQRIERYDAQYAKCKKNESKKFFPSSRMAHWTHINTLPNLMSPPRLMVRRSLSSGRNRFVDPQRPAKQVLDRQKQTPNAIHKKRQHDHESRDNSIEPVMIRRRDNHRQNERRVRHSRETEEHSMQNRATGIVRSRAAEQLQQAGVVEECTADDEGVGEMQTWHCRELVHVVCSCPDAFGVFLSHCVAEAVLFGE